MRIFRLRSFSFDIWKVVNFVSSVKHFAKSILIGWTIKRLLRKAAFIYLTHPGAVLLYSIFWGNKLKYAFFFCQWNINIVLSSAGNSISKFLPCMRGKLRSSKRNQNHAAPWWGSETLLKYSFRMKYAFFCFTTLFVFRDNYTFFWALNGFCNNFSSYIFNELLCFVVNEESIVKDLYIWMPIFSYI